MSDDGIEQARRWFAEELRLVARVEDPRVVDAFASVPRERFVGPGPLRILSSWNMKDYWTPPDAGPAAVYHDVLIAYDEQRRLNNGQPSLWAFVFDRLGVARGERVVHLGCGMGYYSAILAELVGPTGTVLAIEIDELLAGRAREALAPWPQVTVVNGDGTDVSWRESDVVVASAGATHPLPAWLQRLSPAGRLVFPMTTTNAGGGMLLAKRGGGEAFEARFLCPAWFYEFAGARDADVSDRLQRAFAEDRRRREVDSHRPARRRRRLLVAWRGMVSLAPRVKPFETKGELKVSPSRPRTLHENAIWRRGAFSPIVMATSKKTPWPP